MKTETLIALAWWVAGFAIAFWITSVLLHIVAGDFG